MVILESDVARAREYEFDHVMDSTDRSSLHYVGQERCYEMMAGGMVSHSLKGYSTCLFCYGQTGTGKTTTILGRRRPESEQGLLLRLVRELFQEASALSEQGNQVHCSLQIVEVYNEKLRDLLSDGHPEVHVHPRLGVYLKHARDQPVSCAASCLGLIEEATARQTVACHAMNVRSSRGHTVYKRLDLQDAPNTIRIYVCT